MKKKILLIFLILGTVLLITSKKIYKSLSEEHRVKIKFVALAKYNNLSDASKILLRTLNLEPFPFLEGWYRRTNPKINNLNNDYNEKFLPETQYGNFNLDFIKINFTEKYEKTNDKGFGFFRPFYLELLNEKIIIVNGDGEILYAQESDLYKKEDKNQNLITKKIKSNLTELGTWSDKKKYRVMGTLIHENKIYISHSTTIEEKCEIYHISYADINFNNLIFDNFFTSNECGHHLRAGRMQFLNYNGEDGILATIGGETVTSPTLKAQNLNSDIGKTLFIDFKNKKKLFIHMVIGMLRVFS